MDESGHMPASAVRSRARPSLLHRRRSEARWEALGPREQASAASATASSTRTAGLVEQYRGARVAAARRPPPQRRAPGARHRGPELCCPLRRAQRDRPPHRARATAMLSLRRPAPASRMKHARAPFAAAGRLRVVPRVRDAVLGRPYGCQPAGARGVDARPSNFGGATARRSGTPRPSP